MPWKILAFQWGPFSSCSLFTHRRYSCEICITGNEVVCLTDSFWAGRNLNFWKCRLTFRDFMVYKSVLFNLTRLYWRVAYLFIVHQCEGLTLSLSRFWAPLTLFPAYGSPITFSSVAVSLSLIVSLGLLGPNNNLQFEARGSDFRNSEKRVRKMPSLGKKQPHAQKIMFYLRRWRSSNQTGSISTLPLSLSFPESEWPT